MTSQAPAGWYTDPSGADGQRWWNGQSWSDSVAPVATQPAGSPAVPDTSMVDTVLPAANAPAMTSVHSYPVTQQTYQSRNAPASNRTAFITFAVVAVYLVIALETRLVVFGFLPLGLALRSNRQREPLAPFAIGAAVLSIGVAALRIFGH
jgi:hypothetical protein